MKPLVSIIIPTYNRANTVGRTIDSILLQTYDTFEIIVVEDGSKDDTVAVLKKYTDKRIRIIYHEMNKGVTAAKNTGLNNIQGEWFTILDSDDEIVADALEIMMKVPMEKDGTVTAVTCNCIDTNTGKPSGHGLDDDQYVDFNTLINVCTGEFWGLTKTNLLLNDRFNEKLGGFECTLWFKMNERAKRFYVHNPLRIYHTEGDDRVSKIPPSIKKISNHFLALAGEEHYMDIIRKYQPGNFVKDCLRGSMYLVADKKKTEARFYVDSLKKADGYGLHKIVSFFVYHSNAYLMTFVIKFLTIVKIIQ
ncbi:hypothetical protein BH11BAC4_BH11BAC4_04420 [soil metagenome]